MIAAGQAAQVRLAWHYVGKLRTAATTIDKGGASRDYGLKLIELEWPNIQHWQSHAAGSVERHEEWARLCSEYVVAGGDTIFYTCTPAQRILWWSAAIKAARRLDDHAAERMLLAKLAGDYSYLGALDKAQECAQQLFNLAQQHNDLRNVGKAAYLLATVAEDQGRQAEAVDHYRAALGVFEQLESEVNIGRSLLGLGAIALDQGRYEEAHACFLRYLKLTEKGGREGDRCFALQAVAEALKDLKRYAEADQHFEQAVTLSRQLGFQAAIGQSLMGRGACALAQGNVEAAIRFLNEGLPIARQHSGVRDVVHGLTQLGYAHWRKGESSAALTRLREALERAQRAELPLYAARAQKYLSLAYLTLGDVEAGRGALRAAIATLRQPGAPADLARALPCAIAYAQHMGLSEQAARWLGALVVSGESDPAILDPVRQQIEISLGAERCQSLMQDGKTLPLESVLDAAQKLLEA